MRFLVFFPFIPHLGLCRFLQVAALKDGISWHKAICLNSLITVFQVRVCWQLKETAMDTFFQIYVALSAISFISVSASHDGELTAIVFFCFSLFLFLFCFFFCLSIFFIFNLYSLFLKKKIILVIAIAYFAFQLQLLAWKITLSQYLCWECDIKVLQCLKDSRRRRRKVLRAAKIFPVIIDTFDNFIARIQR